MTEMAENSSGQRLRVTGGVVVALLAVVAVIGFVAISRFVEADRARDLRAWQVRLGIVADSRRAAIEEWFEARRRTVTGLAANPSVSLYMTQLSLAGNGDTKAPAEADYLRNLLVATASQSGFDAPLLGPDVAANVERQGTAGLALVNASGAIVAASAAMPALAPEIRKAMAGSSGSETAFIDFYKGPRDLPSMAFIAPLFSIQADPSKAAPNGFVVGVRLAGKDLYGLLAQPGDIDETARTYLVRRRGALIDYLSPLDSGQAPLARSLDATTPRLAAAFATANPGGFARAIDYDNREVLVTARKVRGTPWILLRTVSRAEALGASDHRRRNLFIFLGLGLFGLLATVLLVWRHGTSLRSQESAERYRTMSDRFAHLSHFLQVVADGQPTAITTLDEDGRYRFANQQAALDAGIDSADFIGKEMTAVLGPVEAAFYQPANRQALDHGVPVFRTHAWARNDGQRIVKSGHIPIDPDAAGARQVLMVVEDVTDLVSERERRENNLRQLVSTIMGIIDRRDPFAARHSSRVAEVAEAIAGEMGLDDVEVETAEIAGALMNLGKILVPAELLVASGPLSDDDLSRVREAMLTSADLLQGVDFDGPVVATIRQIQARWDGRGIPEGLAGEDILITARIVAVANSFVGMVSARAWRAGNSFDDAMDYLLAHTGRIYDRRAVAALANILDNRQGRQRWAEFGEMPA